MFLYLADCHLANNYILCMSFEETQLSIYFYIQFDVFYIYLSSLRMYIITMIENDIL